MPHAQIQAVSYAGDRKDVNYQSDARDLGGPLDAQVREALHFVRRNMRVQAAKAMARSEFPQLSERAVAYLSYFMRAPSSLGAHLSIA
jgi:hypothetical protein